MALADDRRRAFRGMATLANNPIPVDGVNTVLYDGMWNNPNFWLRLSLIRAALGLQNVNEIGITGKFNASKARAAFTALNIKETVPFKAFDSELQAARHMAEGLIGATRKAEDILAWALPEDLPGNIVYDGLLKRQRTAIVDLEHPNLISDVTEALVGTIVAARILDTTSPQLVLVSHLVEFSYGILAWIAVRRSIPIVLLFGQLGVLRFIKIRSTEEFFDFMDCAQNHEIAALPEAKADQLKHLGDRFLSTRLSGKHNDLGSVYAYRIRTDRIDRAGIIKRFSWDASKPIVSVYAGNWFDYPHCFGMSSFRDFLDWIEVTLEIALQTPQVQWLFKAHPCDDWYGGVTLEDLVSVDTAPHIELMPREWSGLDIIDSSDALITVQSTAAVEFASMNRPVLVADDGWYGDCGFARCASSREDYISLLKSPWWEDVNIDEAARRATIFAGLYFGHPDWQDNFIQFDDSSGDILYASLCKLLETTAAAECEIVTLRDWFDSNHRRYHTYKMLNTDNYATEILS